MCGFVGFLGRIPGSARDLLGPASCALDHRGPDDIGLWHDTDAGIALAHRRLSVIDLSAAGLQPMASHCGRFVIAYNGEIYNHRELRASLDEEDRLAPDLSARPVRRWRGGSDTETLLAAISRWGIERALTRSIGMFAFALWDRELRTLTLARDRMGEKPLYYGWVGAGLAFASELKALRAMPGFSAGIDTPALAAYMAQASGTVAAPQSIYQGIRKLMPGGTIVLRQGDVDARRLPAPAAYWSLTQVIRQARRDPLRETSPKGAVDLVDEALGEAVGSQMLADVPLGAFLSGGVDSSLIVAMMQRRSAGPVSTFSIGFHDARYDESAHARAVAAHLGTKHHQLIVDERVARDVIPELGSIFCEPFADRSQIPTVLVSRLARREVTVCLSGDGGDELFGGYRRYRDVDRIWHRRAAWPAALARLGAGGLGMIGAERLSSMLMPIAGMLPAVMRKLADPAVSAQLGALLRSERLDAFYASSLASSWPSRLVCAAEHRATADHAAAMPGLDGMEAMMAADQTGYLPNTILTKVDRAAMSASLESRIPMLDVRVVELAWRLPRAALFAQGEGKWVLRRLLDRYVPAHLTHRPKQGFGVPIDQWLRGPLRDWAQALLEPGYLRRQGLFDETMVTRRWREHLDGRFDWQFDLWTLLMFQAWYETWMKPGACQHDAHRAPRLVETDPGHGDRALA
ncbi:MAG: asparagine synthase (glutamine-hydrolyzing) [Burkholderiaceae bacterium]